MHGRTSVLEFAASLPLPLTIILDAALDPKSMRGKLEWEGRINKNHSLHVYGELFDGIQAKMYRGTFLTDPFSRFTNYGKTLVVLAKLSLGEICLPLHLLSLRSSYEVSTFSVSSKRLCYVINLKGIHNYYLLTLSFKF